MGSTPVGSLSSGIFGREVSARDDACRDRRWPGGHDEEYPTCEGHPFLMGGAEDEGGETKRAVRELYKGVGGDEKFPFYCVSRGPS